MFDDASTEMACVREERIVQCVGSASAPSRTPTKPPRSPLSGRMTPTRRRGARRNQDHTDTGTTTRGDGPGDDNRCRSDLRVASSLSVHGQGQVGRLPRGDGRAQWGRDPVRRRHPRQDDHSTFRTTIIDMTRVVAAVHALPIHEVEGVHRSRQRRNTMMGAMDQRRFPS
jgi:hypothetical protein